MLERGSASKVRGIQRKRIVQCQSVAAARWLRSPVASPVFRNFAWLHAGERDRINASGLFMGQRESLASALFQLAMQGPK